MTPREKAQAFADAQNKRRKMKIRWKVCSCGEPICGRLQIENMGINYQGSGFDMSEAKLIVKAFDALAEDEWRAK